MPAEPSAAGYGCREASEVMASVVGREDRSASGERRYSIGLVRAGVSFFLSLPSQPAGRGICRTAWIKNVGRCARQAWIKSALQYCFWSASGVVYVSMCCVLACCVQ